MKKENYFIVFAIFTIIVFNIVVVNAIVGGNEVGITGAAIFDIEGIKDSGLGVPYILLFNFIILALLLITYRIWIKEKN